MTYTIQRLHISHTLFKFDCCDPELNRFFDNAFEEMDRGNSTIYVMIENNQLIGYFAVSMNSVYTKFEGNEMRWPAALIGQLAVDKNYQLHPNNYGTKLINEALNLIYNSSKEIACRAVLIHTYKKELVDSFFEKNGFKVYNCKKKDGRVRYDMVYDLMDYKHGKNYYQHLGKVKRMLYANNLKEIPKKPLTKLRHIKEYEETSNILRLEITIRGWERIHTQAFYHYLDRLEELIRKVDERLYYKDENKTLSELEFTQILKNETQEEYREIANELDITTAEISQTEAIRPEYYNKYDRVNTIRSKD